MNRVLVLRLLAAVAVLALCAWIVANTSWQEEDVPDAMGARAEDDRFYALRRVLQAAGSTLETTGDFEPLPPAGATLLLDSSLWDVFPDRDARLRRWVEDGGHLVVMGMHVRRDDDAAPLQWLPLVYHAQRAPGAASRAMAARPDDDDGDEAPASAPARPPAHPPLPQAVGARCHGVAASGPALPAMLEEGRAYEVCAGAVPIRPFTGVVPAWTLAATHVDGVFALELPVGRGRVTAVALGLPFDNRGLVEADDALLVAAALHAGPGHVIRILEDESRSGFAAWLWRVARGPVLLALLALATALWRLAVRFGPREIPPARARRSMGEQVRGMGEFILAREPAALHGAARHALDEVARGRIDGYATLDEDQRADALAALLPQAGRADAAGLRAAMDASPRPTKAHWLAAIETLEHARRTLLRTTATVRATR